MATQKNNKPFVKFALHILGFSLCTLPPAICTLMYFPLWKSVGYKHCLAGGCALILVLCFFPILRFVGRAIRSHSSYIAWLICFALFFSLSRIAEQMTVISMVGFVGNILGECCFGIAKRSCHERE